MSLHIRRAQGLLQNYDTCHEYIKLQTSNNKPRRFKYFTFYFFLKRLNLITCRTLTDVWHLFYVGTSFFMKKKTLYKNTYNYYWCYVFMEYFCFIYKRELIYKCGQSKILVCA